MPKYRKKPVVIEALKWDGLDHRAMYNFLTGDIDGYIKPDGEHFTIDHSKVIGGLVIKTNRGIVTAQIGDYIIKGVSGEFYPCKPDIFAKTYEEVTDHE